ncbi:MAG: DUF1573 domain-containing protein [Chlorobi bacterium]|nr:DUF1573 domain-containing protein [Chlorobiota bacterium]
MDIRFTFLLLVLIFTVSCRNHQGMDKNNKITGSADTGKAIITFNHYEHDFGIMTEGEALSHTFFFKNTGTGNLLIRSAATSCGCTVSKYDKKPIAPGDSGRMEVVFNSTGKIGKQRKTIAVRANTNPQVTLLAIYADVHEKE